MTDSRKTQLEVGADSSEAVRALDGIVSAAQTGAAKVEQAGERMAEGIGELPKSSDAAARKIERDTQSMAASIQRATAVAKAGGAGTAAYYQVLASQRGLDLPTLKPLLDDLSAAQAAIPKLGPAIKQVTTGLGEGEMSAKAMAAAMRGLPAQVTDIVTSLQGGQRPLTVLFQQGGQIKDMFGGAGNAVSAVGRYLVQLISPASVAAASVALLGAAWLSGSKEAQTFNQTLILSGSASGYYTGQLTATARAIRELGSGTQGRATEVLNEMAQSAGVGSENLLRFTDAALRLQRAGGPAAEVTARAFKDLAKAPLEAALKLNQQQNFLTPQIYEQIKALVEQGRTTAAVRVVQEAYFDSINGRVPKLEQNLGLLERAWRGVADTAKLAWDGMLDIGRTQDPIKVIQDQIAALDKRADYRRPGQAAPENEQRARAVLEGRLATAQAEAAAKQKVADADNRQLEATQALKALDDTANQYLPRRIAMERELAQVRESAAKALTAPNLDDGTRKTILAQQRAAEKGIRDKFDPGITQAQAQSEAAAIERQLGIMTSAYSDAQRVMEALHQSGIVNDREYYNARRSFIELDRDAGVRGLQAQIDATTEANKSDKLTTAQRIANGDKILDLQAKISQAKGKAATDTILLGIQETAALNNVTKAYEQAKTAAQEYLDQLQRSQSRDLSRFNLSDGQRQREQGRDQIEDKYAADRIRIRNEMSQLSIQQNGSLTEQQRKQYADLLQLNQQFEDAALKSYDGYVQQRLGMESDWTNGAQRAWNEYLETVRNVSQQTHDLISNALNGGTDALANYLAAGKYTFNEFGRVVGQVAQQVLAELLKIYIRQQLVGIIGSISGSAASAGAGVNGSAGSAYIPSNVAHGGGVMGAESFTQRVMPASTWSGAPRYHTGMAPDEYAAILQEGEGVFTKEQMRRLGPAGGRGDVNLGVNVNLINQSGQDMKATATKRGDGGIDVLLQAFEQSMAGNVSSGTGPLSRAIQSRFGLRASTSL